MKIKLLLLSVILILINCTSPPIPEPALKLIPEPAIMVSSKNNDNSLKKLEENTADTIIENSTVIIKFLEDDKIEEHHQIIFRAENLPSGNFYSSKNFIISLNEGQDLENIDNICEKMEKSEDNPDNNNCLVTINKYDDFYMFLYRFKLYNNEHIIINYSYNITKSIPEILYRQESVIIPDYNQGFCDYTFIIPEGYISLGLQDDSILTNKSNEIYTYYGNCPSYSKEEIIRFTPKESFWKANIGIYSELSEGFSNNVNISFPRYYQGGKLNLRYYRLFPYENNTFNKKDIILDDLYYNISISSVNKRKIGIELYTSFSNKLNNKFNVIFPEIYYEVNNDQIDPTIKKKAEQIINDKNYYPGYPDYYKLGKFVYSNINYNENYISKNYSPLEIYYLKAGVSNHLTLLYNTMLNAVNIPTLTIVGWAFKKDETTGYNSTFNHTWTAALIDGKWIELDSTWDLFEGVTAGHVIKSFFSEQVYYSFDEKEGINPLCEQNSIIEMITNISEFEEPFHGEIEEYSDRNNINENNNTEEFENIDDKNITNIIGTKDIDLDIDDNTAKEKTEFNIDNGIPIKDKKGNNSVEGKAYIIEKHSLLLLFLFFLILI